MPGVLKAAPAVPRPALPAPGSGLGSPRPARPRRPGPSGPADLAGQLDQL